MELNSIITQRKEIKNILTAAEGVFGKYKVDFDYISNSGDHITFLNHKYKVTWPKGVGIFLLFYTIGAFINFIFKADISFLLGLTGVVLYAVKSGKKRDSERNKILTEVSRRFEILQRKYDEFEYKDYIHIKYVSPSILEVLQNYIDEGRADNLKEAINLMHLEEHNNKMLKKQEDIFDGLNSARKRNTALGIAAIATIVLTGGIRD